MNENPVCIKADEIDRTEFMNQEVLRSKHEKKMRTWNLDLAVLVGKFTDAKIRVIFETLEGIKQVVTIIKSADSKSVQLENGVVMPTYCIRHVEINHRAA